MKHILLCALILLLTGCATTPVAKDEPLRRYELKGQVQRLDTQGKVPIATIKHEAIGDWMGAMTMDFPVKDPADLAKLKEGAPVHATVFVRGLESWVGEVKDDPPAPSK
jgi:Cu/Ag efflux protein CusF